MVPRGTRISVRRESCGQTGRPCLTHLFLPLSDRSALRGRLRRHREWPRRLRCLGRGRELKPGRSDRTLKLRGSKALLLGVANPSPLQAADQKGKQQRSLSRKSVTFCTLCSCTDSPTRLKARELRGAGAGGVLVTKCARYHIWHLLLSAQLFSKSDWTDGWVGEWVDGRMGRWMDGFAGGWMDARVGGWVGG